ncbi:MAG TPA: divergent PAP2 family protein [Anaerolineales bacterium]|nr:divergent PAP2 family protein [Anaerolineales bacterium]HLF03040.1 divergent PAP2 family protein [Anaerolineales bacterium]
MNLSAIFQNVPLLCAATAWGLAQIIKVPVTYLFTREVDWSLLLSAGGMPSSHSALVTALGWAIGLEYGFDSPVFAIAFISGAIVIYDATGVRRAAGEHAKVINRMIAELVEGHPLKEKELKELLGHTPRQVFVGIIFGWLVGWVTWWYLKG